MPNLSSWAVVTVAHTRPWCFAVSCAGRPACVAIVCVPCRDDDTGKPRDVSGGLAAVLVAAAVSHPWFLACAALVAAMQVGARAHARRFSLPTAVVAAYVVQLWWHVRVCACASCS